MPLAPAQKKMVDTAVIAHFSLVEGMISDAALQAYIKGNLQTQTYEKIKPSFYMAETSAARWWSQYSTDLKERGGGIIGGEFVPWMDEWKKDVRGKFTDIIEEAIDEGWGIDQTGDEIQDLLDVESSRGDKIARTEIARSMFWGRIQRIKQGGYTKARWKTAPDREDVEACDECKAMHNTVWDVDAFPEQPLHPNCRCICVPVLSSLEFPTGPGPTILTQKEPVVLGETAESIGKRIRTLKEMIKKGEINMATMKRKKSKKEEEIPVRDWDDTSAETEEIPREETSTDLQVAAVILSRKRFSKDEAHAWCQMKGYTHDTVHITENLFRFDQTLSPKVNGVYSDANPEKGVFLLLFG